MNDRLHETYGMCLMIGGLAVALWTLSHPWGTIAGPEVGASVGWIVSHTLHFVGGFFGSIGLLGLVGRQPTATRLERVGFFVAFAGTVMFTGTGIITGFMWPIMATHAPELVELSGPFFTPPHPVIGITALAYSVGYILLSVALARSEVIAWSAAAMAVIGAVLLIPPPPPLSPVPWVFFPVGGLLLGLGQIAIGMAVRSGRAAGTHTVAGAA